MKKVLAAMAVMFLVMVFPLGGMWGMLLKPIIGGGVEQTFLYPNLYWDDTPFRHRGRVYRGDP